MTAANYSHFKIYFEDLLNLNGGVQALNVFEQGSAASASSTAHQESEDEMPVRAKAPRRRGQKSKMRALYSTEDELFRSSSKAKSRPQKNRIKPGRPSRNLRSGGRAPHFKEPETSDDQSESATSSQGARRVSARQKSLRKRAKEQEQEEVQTAGEYEESSDDENINLLSSDVLPKTRRKKRSITTRRSRTNGEVNGISFERAHRAGTRTSKRSTRARNNMEEANINDIYRSDSENDRRPTAPKTSTTREQFKALSRSEPFVRRHMQHCDTCGNRAGPQGHLIYCQGCALAYHKPCLGHRTGREHLVTKIGEEDFVLQCRRCVNVTRKKDPFAPDQSMCQSCREMGPACTPFRARKTPQQEEREREENDGTDPSVTVISALINNAENVLFRCVQCWRAFHFHHLISKTDAMDYFDDETLAEERFREYGHDWTCKECLSAPAKIAGLVAWRPVDLETYMDVDTSEVSEDAKEYLIKWEKKSYFRAKWMPGAWTWGVTSPAMRKAFAKRDNGQKLPVSTTDEAIPEDYLRIDIIFDVKFTSIVDTRAEEVDKARIREVDTALVKYKGLNYDDVVWETVPTPEDGERWSDFVKAYDDWVTGRYVKQPKGPALKVRIEKARSQQFKTLERSEQPKKLVGGELMKYQLEGINWLYYRWYKQTNGILADEMGLGKTIQIIGLLATLVEDHNCFPFLIVVPNSTCPNWRREIKQWAPSLRVVTYFGTSGARRLAYEHELFPEGSKTLRAHCVVTSYEAAGDDSCRRFFKSVPWQGLIVDEGQRLKSDKTNLYGALSALKIPYTVLLTGTPLQNNARELFNLLQFLDSSFDAPALELEYAELTKENVPQLHDMIRPFFLRRTKAQVLSFLPPMGQVIVPVSMSVLQKKLYKSILAKNPELVKAIFNSEKAVAKSERANLSNILMQLRKCLCHPFVYSQDIEERSSDHEIAHRNLVEASAKLQLLTILLPKLQAREHRVLIFSQFLGMLDIIEDFLNGLGMLYQRLDGSMSSLEKQKRIDHYNAPGSELFAFLLSTRAGGVGINLATADTVIILDPDFNPHRDIQALSRAHRIGQKKKVLCFQLMTRASVEEKMIQIGRRKMALDHVLIEQMDADEENVDMESILRHGAAEILDGDDSKEIKYDESSVDKLLDRSQMEETKANEDHTAESQFSFARVWANDNESLADSINDDTDEERVPDPGVWEKILQERERVAAEEAARRQQNLGRGKRARQTIDYTTGDNERAGDTPQKVKRQRKEELDSDTDFQVGDESEAEKSMEEHGGDADLNVEEAAREQAELQKTETLPPTKPRKPAPRFRRSNIDWPSDPSDIPELASQKDKENPPPVVQCLACHNQHRQGYCPLKIAGPETCNLCGIAHYGVARTCPHIRSETQVRSMLNVLKKSPEQPHVKAEAVRYLQGVKGTLAQAKRIKAARGEANAQTARDHGFADPRASMRTGGPTSDMQRSFPPVWSTGAPRTSSFVVPQSHTTPTSGFTQPMSGKSIVTRDNSESMIGNAYQNGTK